MQRLTKDDRERGGVAVLVAVLMVPLLAFTGVVINIGSMLSEKQQLQNGADAAALAIAQDCAAAGACVADQTKTTADKYADENLPGARALPPDLSVSGAVTVTTVFDHQNLFASVLDADPKRTIPATATAKWGAPSRGTTMLPLTISECAVDDVAGKDQAIDPSWQCPEDGNLPGGFGWVDSDPGICGRTTAVGGTLTPTSNSGESLDGPCKTAFPALVDKVVLLPVYANSDLGGSNGVYHITRYAAFVLTGYRFPSLDPVGTLCHKQGCISGKFIEYVSLDDAWQYSPNDTPSGRLSVTIVALTG